MRFQSNSSRSVAVLLFGGLALLALSCGPPGRPESARAVAGPRARPATRYRVGDWVEYRYTGQVPGRPTTMCEQVIRQQGSSLEILVTLTRGEEQRAWVQVLTDTPANQRANRIDALYELRDGRRHRLANPQNRDILRLCSWFLVMPDGRATDIRQAKQPLTFAGRTYACAVVSGRNAVGGMPARFTASRCPGFLWTNGPGRFYLVSPEKDLVRSEVVATGRQTAAALRRAPRCAVRSK